MLVLVVVLDWGPEDDDEDDYDGGDALRLGHSPLSDNLVTLHNGH